MDKRSLETFLALGLSLEQIGKRVRRDPSTVGYWVKKHGLKAVHRDRHAPRGGLRHEEVAALIEQGHSHESMAAQLGVSVPTVRYWLKKFGLRTERSSRIARAREARKAGQATVQLACRHHGLTDFWLEGRGHYRCLRCRQEAVARRRRKVKALLVAEAGGACRICGYDRYPGALHFHHLDPAQKRFTLSQQGVTRGIEHLRREAGKCVLLCSNCHAEVEGGLISATLQPMTMDG